MGWGGAAGGVSQRDSERSLKWWLHPKVEGAMSWEKAREGDVAVCTVLSPGTAGPWPSDIVIIIVIIVLHDNLLHLLAPLLSIYFTLAL